MNSRNSESATTIRYPATANLLVDSEDRTTGDNFNFSITRPNALFNGFLRRVGVTEIVLTWNVPNIAASIGNSTQTIDVNTVGVVSYTIPDGIYTAEQAILAWIALVNAAAPGGIALSAATVGNICTITATGQTFRFPAGNGFLLDLGWGIGGAYATSQSAQTNSTVGSYLPLLQQYKYLDFVCNQLTLNQDIKDASTAPIVRDVLARWYLASDTDLPLLDSLGFPISYTSQQFTRRRIFSPPKQIQWATNIPVGNLTFEVWATPTLAPYTPVQIPGFEYQMTLQASEN